MKTNKIIASSLFAGLFMLSSVSADTAITEPETAMAVEEEASVEDAGPNCCCSPFGGFYFGLGLGWNIMKLKGELKGAKDATMEKIEGFKFSADYEDSASKNANRFVGTLMLGGGKLWDNGFYVGGNFYFDLGQNKKVKKDLAKVEKSDTFHARAEMNTGAWSPALALRLGFVPASYNTAMVYLDLGAAYNKSKIQVSMLDADNKVVETSGKKSRFSENVGKVTPLVRLGVQKAIGSKFIAGLEVEYKFQGKKTWGKYTSKTTSESASGYRARFKFADGFTVRLIGTCNFKF